MLKKEKPPVGTGTPHSGDSKEISGCKDFTTAAVDSQPTEATIENAAWQHNDLGEYYLDKAVEAIEPRQVETFTYYYTLFLKEVSIFQHLSYGLPAPFDGRPGTAPRAISAADDYGLGGAL